MEKSSIIQKDDINKDQIIKTGFAKKIYFERVEKNPIYNTLVAEGGVNFFHYIDWLNLAKDPNLMILSSLHHYYYDFNELRGIKTLINVKTLNQINHIDNFLNNVFRVLPPKANFVGSFIDNKIRRGVATPIYQSFRLLNRLINILDSKTEKFVSRKKVLKLLDTHGFKVIDMTEIDGVTYFYSQISKKPGE